MDRLHPVSLLPGWRDLSVRAFGTLRRLGVQTAQDVSRLHEDALMEVTLCGHRTTEEILAWAEAAGIPLRRLRTRREQTMGEINPALQRDMEVLVRRWGRGRRYSLRSVGLEMGITGERVRQRELRASRWIRAVLAQQGYDVVPREGRKDSLMWTDVALSISPRCEGRVPAIRALGAKGQ